MPVDLERVQQRQRLRPDGELRLAIRLPGDVERRTDIEPVAGQSRVEPGHVDGCFGRALPVVAAPEVPDGLARGGRSGLPERAEGESEREQSGDYTSIR